MSYKGQCSCGRVAFAITGKPKLVAECWCGKCQRYGGGGSTVNALFEADQVSLRGELGWHRYEADSGNQVEVGFCRACGTHVAARTSGRPGCTIIRLGAVDQPHDLVPAFKAFTQDAPAWSQSGRLPDQSPPMP